MTMRDAILKSKAEGVRIKRRGWKESCSYTYDGGVIRRLLHGELVPGVSGLATFWLCEDILAEDWEVAA